MPRYSKLAEFARTRGAKDKRPRKKRADSLDDQYKSARTNELRTRSIANLGRTLNSVGNSVREVRLTARWLGINPARKRSDPMSIIRNARSGSDAGNSFLRLVRGVSGTRSQNSRTIVNGKGVISSVTAVGRSGGLFGMRSLNSMMAEFGRGKDKRPRKKKTLSGAIQKGASIGMQTALGAGMLGGIAYGISKGRQYAKIDGVPFHPIKDSAIYGLLGANGGAVDSMRYLLPAGLAGGAVGAGAYGINKLREKSNKKSTLDQLLRR